MKAKRFVRVRGLFLYPTIPSIIRVVTPDEDENAFPSPPPLPPRSEEKSSPLLKGNEEGYEFFPVPSLRGASSATWQSHPFNVF